MRQTTVGKNHPKERVSMMRPNGTANDNLPVLGGSIDPITAHYWDKVADDATTEGQQMSIDVSLLDTCGGRVCGNRHCATTVGDCVAVTPRVPKQRF